jgi:RimJ/RimL family protein N-acetyltransferase
MHFNTVLSFNIDGNRYYYRCLSEEDVNSTYINGLNNENKYLVNVPPKATIETQKKYIKRILLSKDQSICGLFLNEELIASAGIQYCYSKAFIKGTSVTDSNLATHGRFVFEEENRGKGYGKTLIWATVAYINRTKGTQWFGGGIKRDNVASIKSDLSCGYEIIHRGSDIVKLAVHVDNVKHPKVVTDIVFE